LIINKLQKRLFQELGYAPDFAKQKDFINLVLQGLDPALPLAEKKAKIFDFCKFLLCQEEKDELQFRTIFEEVFEEERQFLTLKLERKEDILAPKEEKKSNTKERNQAEDKIALDGNLTDGQEDIAVPLPWANESMKKFINFMEATQDENKDAMNELEEPLSNFLLTNDYHVVSFREMIQSWRYFRLRQAKQESNEIDLKRTIDKLAQQGIFTEVVFQKTASNRDDALLIFVDRRGSMTPFHQLTEQLIRTAIQYGGHKKAKVYYFQNYPLEYVYETPLLTNPIPLQHVFASTSLEHTYTMIISDAGAARGNDNSGRIDASLAFVDRLWRNVKDVVWMNPMPRNRWRGTSAMRLAQHPSVKMYSFYDANRLGMTLAIKDLLYEN
jgi:uncharacterized protein with von Willebrand factor type A (vWA) domain